MKTIVIYSLRDNKHETLNARVFENEEKAKKYIEDFQQLWIYYSTFNNVNQITI